MLETVSDLVTLLADRARINRRYRRPEPRSPCEGCPRDKTCDEPCRRLSQHDHEIRKLNKKQRRKS